MALVFFLILHHTPLIEGVEIIKRMQFRCFMKGFFKTNNEAKNVKCNLIEKKNTNTVLLKIRRTCTIIEILYLFSIVDL